MTCKEIAELLMDYCDGELSKEHYELICQHLLLCGQCDNFLATYKITIRVARNLPMAAIPEHVLDRVRAALREEGKEKCG